MEERESDMVRQTCVNDALVQLLTMAVEAHKEVGNGCGNASLGLGGLMSAVDAGLSPLE